MSPPPIDAAHLSALPPECQALLRTVIEHYEGEIAALKAKISELEPRLNKTPQNSSLPPSSQHPHAKPPARKAKSKRRRGGQPGHAKHERPLLPTDQCNDVQRLKPTECRRCRKTLTGCDVAPLRHQVWELPENQAACDGVSTPPPDVPRLRRNNVCFASAGRSTRAIAPAS